MTVTINAVTSTGLVQTSDGSGVIKVQSNGVTTNALAWVSFNGTNGSIFSGYNVSSVTRNSAGDYTINFTNTLSDANYALGGMSMAYSTGNVTGSSIISIPPSSAGGTTPVTKSASAVRIVTGNSSNGQPLDAGVASVIIFGN